jgi:hypothetical protein
LRHGILILILSFFFGNIYPQQSDTISVKRELSYDEETGMVPLEFGTGQLDEYKSQKEFEYIDTVEKDNWWTRFKKWVNAKFNQFLSWLFGDYKANRILAFFIEILPFLLLWLFSRLNPGGRILKSPKKSEVFLTEEEELVKNEDLPTLIKEAVKNANYRLAVRYYYLNELKKLDELQLIDYEYQKTNKDYSEEISDASIKKHFSEITKLYEFIWYGSFGVSEKDYQLVERGFLRMEKLLNSLSHE